MGVEQASRDTHSGTDRQEEVINKRLQRITACVRGCSLLTWPPWRGVCDVIHAPKMNLRMSFVQPSPMSSLAQAQQLSTSFKRDLLSLEVKENSNNDPRVLRQKTSLSLSLSPPHSLSPSACLCLSVSDSLSVCLSLCLSLSLSSKQTEEPCNQLPNA